jgi:hypothetical protein
MSIHVNPTVAERNSASAQFQRQKNNLRRQDQGLRWGAAASAPKGPDHKVLNSVHFELANAPLAARLVPFSEIEDGQCQWGFNHGDKNLFCGVAIVPAIAGTGLFKRYCPHHVRVATGKTVVR